MHRYCSQLNRHFDLKPRPIDAPTAVFVGGRLAHPLIFMVIGYSSNARSPESRQWGLRA
jgi:hypothetical protein